MEKTNPYTNYLPKYPVFIVSTGRSGTTTLTQILQMHPEVCCLNEMQPPLRPEGFMKWAKYWPDAFIEKRIINKRHKLISQIIANGFVYIEGTPPASHLINELHKLFNAKFVHLYCDGREFVRRAAEKGWHRNMPLLSKMFNYIRRRCLMKIVDGGRIDRWLVPPSELKTQIERLAWLWTEVNEVIMRSFSQLPDSYKFSIKMEDIDEKVLLDLHKYIGIKVYPEILTKMVEFLKKQVAGSEKPVFPVFEKWPEKEKKLFMAIAGDMMRKLGYL